MPQDSDGRCGAFAIFFRTQGVKTDNIHTREMAEQQKMDVTYVRLEIKDKGVTQNFMVMVLVS